MTARAKRSPQQTQPRTLAMLFMGSGLFILGILALFLLVRDSLAEPAGSASRAETLPAVVNFPAPELNLTDLDGSPVRLSDYRGQVVLLNNWATWCPPCKAEMPVLQAFFAARQAQGFTIIAIDAGEPADDVRDFVKEYGLTFPVWLDLEQTSLRAFRNMGLPSSYLIDRDGTVRLVWNGAVSYNMLEKYITPLLEE